MLATRLKEIKRRKTVVTHCILNVKLDFIAMYSLVTYGFMENALRPYGKGFVGRDAARLKVRLSILKFNVVS